MEPKMVLPGDQIAVAEEFEPGEGTYEKNGLVFASTPGVLHLDEQTRVARVRPFNPPAELQPGDIVYGVIDDIRGMMATATVNAIHGRSRQVSGETDGTIHISNVSEGAMFVGLGVTRANPVGIALFGSQTAGWGLTMATESIPGPTITVNQNDVVTLSLSSTDGFTHQFLLDYNGNGVADTGEPISALFSTTASLTFTASTAGSFHYMCTIHPTTMHGTWMVTSTNTAPTLTPLSAYPTPAIPGQLVTFSSTSFDADGDVLSYTMTFGDGTSTTGTTLGGGGLISVRHAYAANGAETAMLTVNDGKGGTAGSSASVSIATSLLRVTTNPAVPAKIFVSGVPRDEWGLNWVKLAPGTYTVSFGVVYGYATPSSQTVTVVAGGTANAVGSFVPLGSLRIVTSPAVSGTVFVDNIPRDDWGMWQSMPAGTYTVSFGPVPGYSTPASQTAIVTGGSLTTITGAYTAIQVATASLLPNAAVVASTIPTAPIMASVRLD